MRVAMLGATGRTGTLIVEELVLRGHEVTTLVRSPERLGDLARLVTVLTGNSRHPDALRRLLAGNDVVLSALGPTGKDLTLHQETATALIQVMHEQEVHRFVGISGTGIDAAGDEKHFRARLISRVIRRLGGVIALDKAAEYRVWAASDLGWTLVRPPRLTNGGATGRVEHHAHRPPRASSIRRADLAMFVVDVLEQNPYPQQAPFVAQAQRREWSGRRVSTSSAEGASRRTAGGG